MLVVSTVLRKVASTGPLPQSKQTLHHDPRLLWPAIEKANHNVFPEQSKTVTFTIPGGASHSHSLKVARLLWRPQNSRAKLSETPCARRERSGDRRPDCQGGLRLVFGRKKKDSAFAPNLTLSFQSIMGRGSPVSL